MFTITNYYRGQQIRKYHAEQPWYYLEQVGGCDLIEVTDETGALIITRNFQRS